MVQESLWGHKLTLSSRTLEDEGFTFGASFLGGILRIEKKAGEKLVNDWGRWRRCKINQNEKNVFDQCLILINILCSVSFVLTLRIAGTVKSSR